MRVLIEGFITSIAVKEKDGKTTTDLLVAQPGIKEQAQVRLKGNQSENFSLFQIETFAGRLQQWTQRNGIGCMVVID